MRTVVFGATGRTGKCLVEQALAQGHAVTAFARDPSKVHVSHERLRVVVGDVLDPAAVERAIEEQDAVLCALGVKLGQPSTVLWEGVRNIIHAMETHGVRRFVCISAAGVLHEEAGYLGGKVALWFIRWFFRALLQDLRRQLQEIRRSHVEWVVVRPIMLSDGPRTGKYRVVPEGLPVKGYRISTGDLADFMLRQLSVDEYVRKVPAIAY